MMFPTRECGTRQARGLPYAEASVQAAEEEELVVAKMPVIQVCRPAVVLAEASAVQVVRSQGPGRRRGSCPDQGSTRRA